jgi:hypothetical protein
MSNKIYDEMRVFDLGIRVKYWLETEGINTTHIKYNQLTEE